MIKLRENNLINTSDNKVILGQPVDTSCQISLALREAFPYIKDYITPDVEEVLIYDGSITLMKYQMGNVQNISKETVKGRASKEIIKIDPSNLGDQSNRVKKFVEVIQSVSLS